MWTPVHVDNSPRARSAAGKDHHAFGLRDFVNLQAKWRMKLPRSARRYTPRMRIALAEFNPPYFVQSPGPGHERHLADVQIGRQVVAVLSKNRSGAGIPISEFSGSGAQHRMSVGIPRSRRRGRPLLLSPLASLLP